MTKRILALLLIALLTFSSTALADVALEEPVVNGDIAEVIIAGTAEPDSKVMLIVADKGITIDSIDAIELNSDKIKKLIQISQTFAGDDGSFEFVFKLPKDCKNGDYEYRVSDAGSSDTGTFTYNNPEGVLDELDELRTKVATTDEEKAAKIADVKNLLQNETNIELLKLDVEFYMQTDINSIDDSVFEVVANYTQKIETSEQLRTLINTNHAYYLAETVADEQTLETVVSVCDEVFGFSKSPLYALYTDAQKPVYKKEALGALLDKEEITSPADVVKTMENAMLLHMLNTIENWSEIKSVVGTYGELFELEGTPTDTDFVNVSDLVPFENLDKFLEELNKEIAKPDKTDDDDEDEEKNNNKVSNRGSVSVKGSSVVVPSIQPLDKKSNPFVDMSDCKWAEEAVTELYNAGVINGKTQDTFDPFANVTREEFVKLLLAALNIDVNNSSSHFADVIDGSWYAGYVETAYNKSIVNGISDKQFGVGNSITRQDMVVMIYNAIKTFVDSDVSKTQREFSDYDAVSDYAKQAVTNIAGVGVVNGMPDGSFAPTKLCQRAEAAQIIYNMKKFIEK